MRYALYFTPPRHDPLTRAAEGWLGRSAFTGETFPAQPADPLDASEVAYQTAAARRYGFHATLKAPFHLAGGETEKGLLAAFDDFTAGAQPFRGPRLVLRRMGGFFALVPEAPHPALDRFAGDVVKAFERFRAPLDAAAIERRNPDTLTPSELKHLHVWGYPYVFADFQFHMTLTGRVDAADAPRVERAIWGRFGPLLDQTVEIGSLALFVEPEPGAPFTIRAFQTLGALPARKTA